MREVNWAVLGCGVIANEMAVALQKQGRHIYAVGNRTREKANAIASHTDKQEGMYLAYTRDVMYTIIRKINKIWGVFIMSVTNYIN